MPETLPLHSAPLEPLGRVPFTRALPFMANADLLLWRRRGAISIAGRGVHTHAALFGWWDRQPMVLEVREWIGGRATTLERQVRRYSGRIDVFRANASACWEFDRDKALAFMRELAGCDYGWGSTLAAAVLHLPIVRCFKKADTDDSTEVAWPPNCSHAVARSTRLGGGVDPVPNLADHLTEPADLARSAFYSYFATLEWPA